MSSALNMASRQVRVLSKRPKAAASQRGGRSNRLTQSAASGCVSKFEAEIGPGFIDKTSREVSSRCRAEHADWQRIAPVCISVLPQSDLPLPADSLLVAHR
jgi:hypothetical protein